MEGPQQSPGGLMGPRSCLVTGAYGLVGSWLARALIARGDRVTVLRRDRHPGAGAALADIEQELTCVDGDVRDGELLERVLTDYGIDTIFHLAAQTLVGAARTSPAETFDTNIRGTWLVLEAARRHEVPRTVVASSDKAYGAHEVLPYSEEHALRAQYPYDVSKAAADLIARSYWTTYGLPVAVTRCANIYGGGDPNPSRLIPEAIGAALAGRRPVLRSDGTPERDFLHVDDAVAAYLAVADALDAGSAAGEAFNAGSGTAWPVGDVVRLVCRLAGNGLEPEVLGHGTPAGEISRQWVDTTKIRAQCGWQPQLSLEEGLRRTIEWYRQHPPANLTG